MTENQSTIEPTFADLTTLRVGGEIDAFVATTTEAEFIDVVRAADAAGEPVLVLGGGSNLLVADEGFGGVVVQDRRTGVRVDSLDACGGASITVPAGHSMDDLVAEAVASGWVGLESLSGIPGTVGAAPVQNIGAYGQEISGTLASIRVWDRGLAKVRQLALAELGFGYRTSILKRSTQVVLGETDPLAPWYPSPRYVVLDVTFQLRLGTLSTPIAYPELARRLDVAVGDRSELAAVRRAVLELRDGKGMLVDPASAPDGRRATPDYDRWSAGSFFTNPIVPIDVVDLLPADAPRFPVRIPGGQTAMGSTVGETDPEVVKLSAAWLIEQAGFGKGYGVDGPGSPATLSTKHTLALTNRGSASTQDILRLAREVRDGVLARFGVELVAEPVLVGVAL